MKKIPDSMKTVSVLMGCSFNGNSLSMALKKKFQLKRIYEEPAASDGYRVLVDRLWPRGISKKAAHLDAWIKDLAPSTTLRKWFDHRPDRFQEFEGKYREELSSQTEKLEGLRGTASKQHVTLLYAAKNQKVNHAVILAKVLQGE